MFGLTLSDLEKIRWVMSQHPDMEEALIFGSRAMGNYKPGSDVDIALKGNLNPDSVISIAAELNEQLPLPYRFDVIEYSSISQKPLIEHVDQHGKVFYRKT